MSRQQFRECSEAAHAAARTEAITLQVISRSVEKVVELNGHFLESFFVVSRDCVQVGDITSIVLRADVVFIHLIEMGQLGLSLRSVHEVGRCLAVCLLLLVSGMKEGNFPLANQPAGVAKSHAISHEESRHMRSHVT